MYGNLRRFEGCEIISCHGVHSSVPAKTIRARYGMLVFLCRNRQRTEEINQFSLPGPKRRGMDVPSHISIQ